MKLFGFNITRDSGIQSDTFQAFSTPFRKVGDANLSLPKIDGRYTQAGGYVPFGQDNLFPNLINQLYYTSPLHAAITDFKTNAVLGGGYEIESKGLTNKQLVDVYAFEKRHKLNRLQSAILKDLILHNRVYFKGIKKSVSTAKIKERICPSEIRTNKDKSCYFWAYDWATLQGIKPMKTFQDAEKGEEFLYVYEIESVGQSIYSLPSYTSANNWIFLDGEMSYLQKSNILNSIFPSFAVKFPKKPQGPEEMNMIKDTIEKLKGAENAGKAAAFFANRSEDLPTFETIATNSNDGLFQQTTESIESKICQAHTIDPILMGIRVSGKLGSGTDIKQSYIIFEKNVVKPLREEVEYIINQLLSLENLKVTYSINDYQIINETIIETEDNQASATSDALNAMSPLVATKVLESMTSNEIRALAGLNNVEGGDTTRDQREAIASIGTPSETPEAKEDVVLNDALKGLNAQDNMDIIRIVRDFNKGKLPLALAKSRLAAYGFDAETITEILEQ